MAHAEEFLRALQAIRFHRTFRGYAPSEVDELLARASGLIEQQDKQIQELERKAAHLEEQEELLKATLLRAEKNAVLTRTEAENEARLVKSNAAEQASILIEQASRRLEATENELANYRRLYEARLLGYEHESHALIDRFSIVAKRHVEAMAQEVSADVRELVRRLGADLEILPRPGLAAPQPPVEAEPGQAAGEPIPVSLDPSASWTQDELTILSGLTLERDIFDHQGQLVLRRGTVISAEMIQDVIERGLYGELVTAVAGDFSPHAG
jgi:DivIVA domain-containing protein